MDQHRRHDVDEAEENSFQDASSSGSPTPLSKGISSFSVPRWPHTKSVADASKEAIHRPRHRRQILPPKRTKPEMHLLQKIASRETFGADKRRPASLAYNRKLFSTLPGRLAFCLKESVGVPALESGHVFLGFSKCGQFLLSYTQTTSDVNDLVGSGWDLFSVNYHYRLHWWLFVPSRRAKKVAEVTLFSNSGVFGNMHISVCQWPNDDRRLVVVGVASCTEEPITASSDEDSATPSSKPSYLTVTAVPSLNNCRECAKVASSYEEDDFVAAWNSCVRPSCLEHGMTVHSSFQLVSPYPKFEPKVSLKRDGCIIVNTGNILHTLTINLEELGHRDGEDGSIFSDSTCLPKFSRNSESDAFGHSLCSPSAFSHNYSATSDSEATTDCESECGGSNCGSGKRPANYYVQNQERLEKVAEFVSQLSTPTMKRYVTRGAGAGTRFLPIRSDEASHTRSVFRHPLQVADEGVGPSSRKRMAAEKAYEITEDDFNDGVREKLSTFRKKRLAEKKYEFRDEEAENITPLPRLRSQQRANESDPALTAMKSPRADEESVLRPLYDNSSRSDAERGQAEEGTEVMCCVSSADLAGLMVDTMPVPELLSPGSMMKKDQQTQATVMLSPRPDTQQPPRFNAKFTKRFIEVDDEKVSVITDIEDDGSTYTGYYYAVLPIEAHGSGYQPMAMISNSKAAKLSGRCIKVQQRSLDLEVFCHYMAQKLCQASNMRYWFCNDYDVEVVDLDPVSGDIICVAVVLVKATTVTKRVSHQQRYSISSMQRHKYEACFKFCWNMDNAQCTVIDSEPLKEMSDFAESSPDSGGMWHPARSLSLALQKMWGVTTTGIASTIKSFTNDPVLRGDSLKTIVDADHLVALINNELK